jgi:hypothetical protein
MAPDPLKCTLKTFGTFSTPTFGGVGEPFNDGQQRKPQTFSAPPSLALCPISPLRSSPEHSHCNLLCL